jgi:ATP-dependent DNA ligase
LRYPAIARALSSLPNQTVVDGEVVALDQSGEPSFNTLQNHAAGAELHFFVFDLLILAGRDVMGESLTKRRELMVRHIFPKLEKPYVTHHNWTRSCARANGSCGVFACISQMESM